MQAHKRTGVIAQKVGMSRVFLQSEDPAESGRHVPVTVLKMDNCQVLGVRTVEKDGYSAVQLGVGGRKAKNVNKPLRGQFAKAKVEPKAKVAEFRVQEDVDLAIGTEIMPNHFVAGQYVDVRGITHGKGFAGVMKRHNFRSQRASHGALKVHRQAGSTGQCQDPGRVFKGKKMAGRMGNVWRTQQNLQVVDIDVENGLVIVKGALPGHKGSYVLIQDALKKAMPEGLPFPAGVKETAKPEEKVEEAPAESSESPPESQVENTQEQAPVEAAAPAENAAPAAPAEDENKES